MKNTNKSGTVTGEHLEESEDELILQKEELSRRGIILIVYKLLEGTVYFFPEYLTQHRWTFSKYLKSKRMDNSIWELSWAYILTYILSSHKIASQNSFLMDQDSLLMYQYS